MTDQELFTNALHFIKHHQDGEIAETLRHRGLKYNMIYGVSSSILSDFAKKQGKNQEVANMLWKQNFREAKLLALMLADPKVITDEELENMVSTFNNHELVEIAALNFLAQLPNAKAKAYKWIQDEKEFVKMTGYMLIRRLAPNIKDVKATDLIDFLPLYERDFTNGSFFVRRAVVNSFQEVAYRNPGLKGHIEDATKRVLENNKCTEIELQAKDMLDVLRYC